jgi:hypothetical protein
MNEEKLRYLESLVRHPEETAMAEYKRALPFDPRTDFGAKLIKHIQGHANAGGGYLIIGFLEDAHKKLQHDPKLGEAVAKSYETTTMCQSVGRYLARGQRIELQVHKVTHEGQVYPIISVIGFRDNPYFCAKDFTGQDGKLILKEGDIYIRDVAAKTVRVAGPEHWRTLLKVALQQKQEGTLSQMRALLEGIGLTLPPRPSGTDREAGEVQQWLTAETAQMNHDRERSGVGHMGYLEVAHWSLKPVSFPDVAHLRDVAAKSTCRNTGWPIGVVLTRPDLSPKPTERGIRTSIRREEMFEGFDYWSLSKRGAFYFVRAFGEDAERNDRQRVFYFDRRIWEVAETFLHCANLYTNLQVEPTTEIEFEIAHHGLKGRVLASGNPLRAMWMDRLSCEADRTAWQKRVPLGLLQVNLRELVKEVLGEVFILFDYWKPVESVWESVIQEFLKSRV